MPLYEYECDSCGRRFERIQKFSDPPIAECPTCGGSVRKLLSSPAIQFKGSGFYITDYPKSGSGADSGSKTASDKASKAETSGKSEKSDKSDSSSSGTSGAGSDSNSPSAKPSESTKSDSASPAAKKSDS